jgi:hypothetical protein
MGEQPTSGEDIAVYELRIVRFNEGAAAAVRVAKELIWTAAAILASEIGPDGALAVLEAVGKVLPEKRATPVH